MRGGGKLAFLTSIDRNMPSAAPSPHQIRWFEQLQACQQVEGSRGAPLKTDHTLILCLNVQMLMNIAR